MTPDEHKWLSDLHNWFLAGPPQGTSNLGQAIAATLPVAQGNLNRLNQLLARPVAPTAQEVADAVLKAGGGGGLSEAQLIGVLNRTGLSVDTGVVPPA